MADQTATPEELRRAIQDIERKLSRTDVMLADCYAERSRLIRELRQLCAQLRDAERAASSRTEPLLGGLTPAGDNYPARFLSFDQLAREGVQRCEEA